MEDNEFDLSGEASRSTIGTAASWLGWLLLGEKISLMSILGAVLITLGVIFANKQTAKTGE